MEVGILSGYTGATDLYSGVIEPRSVRSKSTVSYLVAIAISLATPFCNNYDVK